MGRRDRERRERILVGQEEPRSRTVSTKGRARMHKTGYSALQAMGTGNQIKVLRDSLHQGRLKAAKLRKVLEENAYKEMRKGVAKLHKQSKSVTVDALLVEYRNDRDFRELVGEVGLDEAWFVALAEKEYVRCENISPLGARQCIVTVRTVELMPQTPASAVNIAGVR